LVYVYPSVLVTIEVGALPITTLRRERVSTRVTGLAETVPGRAQETKKTFVDSKCDGLRADVHPHGGREQML
jgi:hypothetical protein